MIICTAGHVDHGKTSLIKVLTGIDTDRLKEEKLRKISMVPGYAYLDTKSGKSLSFIDLPGHSDFIKVTINGLRAAKAVLLVISAREGIKAQSIEHLRICQYLGISRFFVILSMSDLLSSDELRQKKEEISLFLDSEIPGKYSLYFFDGKSIEMLSELLRDFENLKEEEEEESKANFTRHFPYICFDRIFNLPGLGKVFTGTLEQGSLEKGSEYTLLSGEKIYSGISLKSLESHGKSYEKLSAASRVALQFRNLPDHLSDKVFLFGKEMPRQGKVFPVSLLGEDLLNIKERKEYLFY